MQAPLRTDPLPSSTIPPTPSQKHEERLAELEAERRRLDESIRSVGTSRLFAILGAITLGLGVLFSGWGTLALAGAGGFTLAFAGLVVIHARMHRRADRLAAAIHYHRVALERLEGSFAHHPSRGDRFLDADHPYADDLDIFGARSLFQLLDFSFTRLGEAKLADWLASPSPRAEILERQAAVRELAELDGLREELAAEGSLLGDDKPDASRLLTWAESSEAPVFPPSLGLLRWVLPVVTIGLFVLARLDLLSEMAWLWSAGGTLLIGISRMPKVDRIADAVSSRERALDRYRAVLDLIEQAEFHSPRLLAIKKTLGEGDARASREIARLSSIVGFFDARRNEVFRFFIGPVLLWDWHCVAALERWRSRSGTKIRSWLEAVGELEALASLATYAADRPSHAFPTLVDEPAFEARKLGHPLLPPDRCVRNDVRLDGPGTALLVTGSNMSGKSTLMRAMGINVVLAMAGAPVCAESLVVSSFELRTSMRVRDSLEEGVSHFYAELLKLKRVLAGLDQPRPLLFLLDEILHGTNSRERRIGARNVLRHLLERGAMGAISTHDLGLVDVGPDLDAKVRKVHFAEQVRDGEMSFDYRLRPGVVQSSNALRLMRMVGIDIDLAEAGHDPSGNPQS